MAQPPDYTRQYDFEQFSTDHPEDQQPGVELEKELDDIKTHADAVNVNLALIQRDDGKVANDSIHKDALDTDALALIAGNWEPKGDWATATVYAVRDMVERPNSLVYVCVTAHTSNDFDTDRTAGKWLYALGSAEANAALANEWAEKAEDSAITGNAGKYSALHHSAKSSTAKTASETAKTASETAKTASETAQTASETAKTASETAQSEASNSADEAAVSAATINLPEIVASTYLKANAGATAYETKTVTNVAEDVIGYISANANAPSYIPSVLTTSVTAVKNTCYFMNNTSTRGVTLPDSSTLNGGERVAVVRISTATVNIAVSGTDEINDGITSMALLGSDQYNLFEFLLDKTSGKWLLKVTNTEQTDFNGIYGNYFPNAVTGRTDDYPNAVGYSQSMFEFTNTTAKYYSPPESSDVVVGTYYCIIANGTGVLSINRAGTDTLSCNGATGLTTKVIPQGSVILLVNNGSGIWSILGLNEFAPILILHDVKATTVAGGTFTAGAWQDRVLLDTPQYNGISGASCTSNVITLPAGTYEVDIDATAHKVNRHYARLYNVSDSAVTLLGMAGENFSSQSFNDRAKVKGVFTITASKTFKIQHYSSGTAATTGFGYPTSLGEDEIYTVAKFTKIA